jgi:hypothetical protein
MLISQPFCLRWYGSEWAGSARRAYQPSVFIPARVERKLRDVLAWRNRPNPVDPYQIIRDALLDSPQGGGEAPQSGPAA